MSIPGALALPAIPAAERLIVATDKLSFPQIMRLSQEIGKHVGPFKIHNFLDAHGPNGVFWLRHSGVRTVFADAKLNDIPETVRERAEALFTVCQADIVTVMACGGEEMIRAAVEVANKYRKKIYAVTVLTSWDDKQCIRVYGNRRKIQCAKFAYMAAQAGVHGIVCSAHEINEVRFQTHVAAAERGTEDSIEIICPGIRLPGGDTHDQKMVETPAGAIAKGATRLVVGRAITQATVPLDIVKEIVALIDAALPPSKGK